MQVDPSVGEQGGRVRGHQNLPAGLAVHARHDAGQTRYQVVVQAQLGLLQQERPAALRTKSLILADLFQMGLREPLRVGRVSFIRPLEYRLAVQSYRLAFDDWPVAPSAHLT